MSNAMGKIVSDLIVEEPKGDFNFEQLLNAMKKLTKERIETIKGEILVKPSKERSSFEQTFLRALTQLTKVQKMRAMSSSELVFSAYNPPFFDYPT